MHVQGMHDDVHGDNTESSKITLLLGSGACARHA